MIGLGFDKKNGKKFKTFAIGRLFIFGLNWKSYFLFEYFPNDVPNAMQQCFAN